MAGTYFQLDGTARRNGKRQVTGGERCLNKGFSTPTIFRPGIVLHLKITFCVGGMHS
jgi:hypothetical protein